MGRLKKPFNARSEQLDSDIKLLGSIEDLCHTLWETEFFETVSMQLAEGTPLTEKQRECAERIADRDDQDAGPFDSWWGP